MYHLFLTFMSTFLNGNFLLVLFVLPLIVLTSAWVGRCTLWVYFFSLVELCGGSLSMLAFLFCVAFCIFFF